MVPDEQSWHDTDSIVHVHAQRSYHMPAFIIGTRAGLEQLRALLDAALAAPDTTTEATLFCTDGEGYGLHVRCCTGREIDRMPTGYTDKEMCPQNRPWPSWMRNA